MASGAGKDGGSGGDRLLPAADDFAADGLVTGVDQPPIARSWPAADDTSSGAGGEFDTLVGGLPRYLPSAETIRQFRVTVVDGPTPGQVHMSTAHRCAIGSYSLNDLVIDHPTVSRFHCEIHVGADGARVFDLKSRNGTVVDGVHVREAYLQNSSLLRLGSAVLRFEFGAAENSMPLSEGSQFGDLVGSSTAMRRTFAMLERAAATDATVLIEGPTGTGKGKAAEGLHRNSARNGGAFIVVDCGAIPSNLLESELFGHEKGAFTGANERRVGAFEEASGGTIFLDEIGELPTEVQPKLLRALENKEIRRVGSNRFRPVDVRVVAATNRDLREEVNAGRFRSDLYYRLAVVKIPIPPLVEHLEDLPELVEEILASLDAPAPARDLLTSDRFLGELSRHHWTGNVRELRNYLERSLVLEHAAPPTADAPCAGQSLEPFVAATGALVPFSEARKTALAAFERSYLEALMARCGGKVSDAARAAGVDRVYVYRLLKRHGLKPSG